MKTINNVVAAALVPAFLAMLVLMLNGTGALDSRNSGTIFALGMLVCIPLLLFVARKTDRQGRKLRFAVLMPLHHRVQAMSEQESGELFKQTGLDAAHVQLISGSRCCDCGHIEFTCTNAQGTFMVASQLPAARHGWAAGLVFLWA